MWIKFRAIALLTALCCSAVATAQQPQPPRRTMAEIVMTPVVYKVPGMERVSVRRDIVYKSGDPRLKMDVYTPHGPARGARRPAVLFIHGGVGPDASPKDWGVYASWGRLVAASGMVGVTFTHRLGFPRTMLTEGAADVSAAVAYVRANADALGIDGDRLCLAAFSAGGPMLSPAMRDRPPHVRCLVAFYAFMDVAQLEPHRQHETPEAVRDLSPITHLAREAGHIAPLFVARAGLDAVPTMNDSIDRFVREAVSKNAAVTVYNHPRGVHGFDNQTDDARSREIIRAALEFMKTHLGVNGGN
jgi:acetyl esterase/lipase